MVKFPCSLEDLPTPALLVDEDVVRRNCEKMLSKAAAAGVNLRPHMKTHKTVEIGLMQVDGSTVSGILVSTLAEARHFARVGFKDITYGVPISRSKMPAVDQICKELHADMTLFVDSNLHVDMLEAFVAGGFSSRDRIPVFLKIDSGYHRAGIDINANREEVAIVPLCQPSNPSLQSLETPMTNPHLDISLGI
jgi:D-serine deaminase-like pyridoxal phosphate-dependent protein